MLEKYSVSVVQFCDDNNRENLKAQETFLCFFDLNPMIIYLIVCCAVNVTIAIQKSVRES